MQKSSSWVEFRKCFLDSNRLRNSKNFLFRYFMETQIRTGFIKHLILSVKRKRNWIVGLMYWFTLCEVCICRLIEILQKCEFWVIGGSPRERVILQNWIKADTNNDGKLDFKEISKLCKSLNMSISAKALKKKFEVKFK